MTGMLASVNSVAEALLALSANVDIIDLKQPALGALGALDIDLVRQIVTEIHQRCPVSATIGDLPMQPDLIFNAAQAMSETGADYIKIGFFPDGDWPKIINSLSLLCRQNIALIAVLFADSQPDFTIVNSLKEAGFAGVMLDTMDKQKGSLMQIMEPSEVGQFVRLAKTRQLLCGLAGSLKLQDITGLLPFQPDYLGFRGALCLQQKRTEQLDKSSILRIKQAVHNTL
ncbi:MAG: (5-formylfuran-3-yl)methyl phosphate synthase [Methylococcales bacterium]|nr:(5-formylfuran-3-yl)methyl phosphate synthase [Methylococcales bacterium]